MTAASLTLSARTRQFRADDGGAGCVGGNSHPAPRRLSLLRHLRIRIATDLVSRPCGGIREPAEVLICGLMNRKEPRQVGTCFSDRRLQPIDQRVYHRAYSLKPSVPRSLRHALKHDEEPFRGVGNLIRAQGIADVVHG